MERQSLKLAAVSNARQLGGYLAADGRKIKNGVLLRSGALNTAAQEDMDILTGEYGLTAVIDLRTKREAAENPDPEMEGVRFFHIPVMEERQDAANRAAIVEIYRLYGDDSGRAYLEMIRAGALADDMYSSFFDSGFSMAAYRRFFDVLLEHEDGALLWHCTGGKDRAGLTAAMVLGVLGTDRETILADFALTNEAYRQKVDSIVAAASAHTSDPGELAQVGALAGVSLPHMQAVFDRAEQECGSLCAFVQQKVGISDAEVKALRDKYLE